MSTLREAFMVELQGMEQISMLKDRIPTDILVCVKFSDGHIHIVYPNRPVVKEMLEKITTETASGTPGNWINTDGIIIKP